MTSHTKSRCWRLLDGESTHHILQSIKRTNHSPNLTLNLVHMVLKLSKLSLTLLHSHWSSVGHGTTKGLSKVSINWSKGITVVVLRIKQKIHGILQKCSWLDPRLAWGYIKILGLGVLTFSLGDQPPQSWHVLMDQCLTTGANRSQYCSPPCWKQCDVNATVLRPAFLP